MPVRILLLTAAALLITSPLLGQSPPNQGVVQVGANASAVAAVVNGEQILEVAVLRDLKSDSPENAARRRPAVVNHLIDLLLIDQYLRAVKVDAPGSEVDARMKQMLDEAKATGNVDLAEILARLGVTEAELRTMVTADLRWENFLKGQADDTKLEQFFNANTAMFDGSQVHGRHILISVKPDASPEAKAAAQEKLKLLRPALDKRVAELLANAPAPADAVAKEKARLQAIETAFGGFAEKLSDCPSKSAGGELGWFPRTGRMVESFAAAAFALQPGQMSDIVETQFGYHVILITERSPGKAVKFADTKDEVREVYGERLRQVMVPQLRQRAQIKVMELAADKP